MTKGKDARTVAHIEPDPTPRFALAVERVQGGWALVEYEICGDRVTGRTVGPLNVRAVCEAQAMDRVVRDA